MRTGRKRTVIPPPTPGARGADLAGGIQNMSGPRAMIGSATIANVGKPSPENQDSYIVSSNESGSKALVGVFDGHGDRGKVVSSLARNALAERLFAHKDLHSDPSAALAGAYSETQQKLIQNHRADALMSGTTAVTAYQHRNKLFVANVGDSRAVLGRLQTARANGGARAGGAGIEQAMRAIDITSDQKPERPDERQRIQAEGGVVQQMVIPMHHPIAGQRMVPVGPQRVWDKSGRCGLGMTRSLGDLNMHPFVTARPEVSTKTLDAKDRLLVLGSDGIWDFVASQEAVNIAAKHKDPTEGARAITNLARARWMSNERMSDDITAVVVHLDHQPASASALPSGRLSTPRAARSSSFTSAPTHSVPDALRSRSGRSRGMLPDPSASADRLSTTASSARPSARAPPSTTTARPLTGATDRDRLFALPPAGMRSRR